MQLSIATIAIPTQEWDDLKKNVSEVLSKLSETREPNQKPEKELMTPKEVCETLKIGRTTFSRFIENGTLETVRIKANKYEKVFVKRSFLEKLMREGNI